MADDADPNAPGDDAAIPAEEERLLARVLASLSARTAAARPPPDGRRGYADEMVSLRDEIGEARLEDVPALVAQMERLQGVSATRGDLQTFLVDPASPYFGHLRLRERVAGRGMIERDVLIGRATFVDGAARVNIVDWRHAPVSQLFYRYSEGSDYEERFGDRDVEGDVVARRTLTIEGGVLLRVACPQGVWARAAANGSRGAQGSTGPWRRTDLPAHALAGGEQTASRPARGVLGAAPAGRQALDRHLPEIAALIDPRQFDLITARGAGVAVIQGGAGSGKTTVGLHRLAYLAYTYPADFPARRLAVVTHGAALAAYIGQVLPSLGVGGVRAGTFGKLAARALRAEIPWLRASVVDEAPPAVTRVKSHPALLHDLERRARSFGGKPGSRAAVELWADLLTDRGRLLALVRDAAEMAVPERDVLEAHAFMTDRVGAVLARDPREGAAPPPREARRARTKARKRAARAEVPSPDTHWTAMGLAQKPGQRTVDSDLPEGVRRVEGSDDDDDQNVRGATGIDGLPTEDDLPILDADDVAILLRACQLLRGAKHPFAHLFVDEAQDLSPMKLSVLIGRTAGGAGADGGGGKAVPSITLAGDTSQRLFLDNGFGDWRGVLAHLGLAHVAIEPLRIAYRSTREIMAVARAAMGPLADPEAPEAPRSGAPVEAFRFPGVGAAVGFLAEALRDLAAREPRATVALLARYPEQTDRYHEGLRRADVPALRRIRAQEFAFRPGVEVTDVRQVKGLEFDYVVMLDANATSYGRDDESRHLFHIGVTRAAYQLWVVVTAAPSPLLADAGIDAASSGA
ncbi:MAG TPA: ATP-binding domain-containing protein [Polyangia bacterium]|nr:ATP-binding domain-containing protein [Polyangia bacterium]